jgi:adenylate kinase
MTLVFVRGISGVGKSTVLAELRPHVARHNRPGLRRVRSAADRSNPSNDRDR